MGESDDIKNFYTGYADRIRQKRAESVYSLRRYAHEQQYTSILRFIDPGMSVLDDGCGEGTLSFMMAAKGARVTGCDISRPNIEACRERLSGEPTSATFQTADSESLPFPDNSFDLVVSSHVLEHLPDFDRGLREVMRVTKKRAVIAIPTVLNLCSLVQVGGGWFYLKGIRSFLALPLGALRMFGALIAGREGVDEQYGGHKVPHLFRFPWVMKRKLANTGFHLVYYEASSECLPYFESLLPLIRRLDTKKGDPPFRDLGYGTTFVVEK